MVDETRAPRKTRVDRREALILIIILIVAAAARMGRPDITEFKADEGRLLTAALVMSDGQFAFRGISSSVGFPNAPMSVWLYAIPLAIWQHPYSATLFTGLLGVAAVGGVYWLSRRYWGVRAATVAALMLAVSPWAIVFARKIWAQNLLPAFAVGWAIGAALAFVEGRRPYIILHLVCLAVAVQIHPSAISLVPATLLFLLIFRRRVGWRYFFIGGALAALTALPFLWYLWGRWRSEGGLPFSTGQSTAELSFDSVKLALNMIGGQGVGVLAGEQYRGWLGEPMIQFLWLAFIVAGVAWSVWVIRRQRSETVAEVAFICLTWFIAPVVVFAFHRTPVYLHYFIVALPAPFILAGAMFDRLLGRLRPNSRVVAWPALLLLATFQLFTWYRMMSAVAQDPLAGGFGSPLGVKLAAADQARQLLKEAGASEVLVVGDGSNPEQEDFPAEFRALLHGLPLRYVHLNHEALFPAGAAALLLDTQAADAPTTTRALYQAAAGDWRSYAIPGGELNYSVGLLPPAAQPPAAIDLHPPPLLANFVRLTGHEGYIITPEGVLWDIHWRPAENPDGADYHFFNHLLDGDGLRIGQADAAAFAGTQWRPGDAIISRFLLPMPNKARPPLTMRVGMYRYPGLENVPVLDEAANPVADAVTIPLTE